jgi:hypothetical protein
VAKWLLVVVTIAAAIAAELCLVGPKPTAIDVGLSPAARFVAAVAIVALAAWLCLFIAFRPWRPNPGKRDLERLPYDGDDYLAQGLGPVPQDGTPRELYLDLVKRCVTNILYEDPPKVVFDHLCRPTVATRFELQRRVLGEDFASAAHTLVGTHRLENIQHCVERVLEQNVPGDLVETGSYRGGATIFMRALLRAHEVTDRRVFVCDSFSPLAPQLPHWTVLPLIQALAAIPNRWWQRKYFFLLQKFAKDYQAFPPTSDPSDCFVQILMWNLRNPDLMAGSGENHSLELVQSRFARYGLLDEQVVFLKGFFADTLPHAPVERIAVLRLDGDLYESTRDALVHLYPKLSPGGYCIIDDYYPWPDCAKAVNEYRQEHGISEEMHDIDQTGVYWRKGTRKGEPR